MVVPSSLKAFVALRYKQVGRLAFDLGAYAVLLFYDFLVFLNFSLFFQRDATATIYVTATFTFILINIHFSRKDLAFLVHHVESYKIILSVEYLAILFPFIVTSLPGGYTYYWSFPILAALVLPYYQPALKSGTMNAWLGFIPFSLFEWRGGLRKIYGPVALLYAGAWAGVMVPYLSILLLWLLTTVCLSFYDFNESISILTNKGGTAKYFLYQKIKLHLQWVMIFFLPIIALHLVFNPNNVWIVVTMVAGIVVLWVFAILAKYSHYVPEHQWIRQSNFTAVMALLAILPFAFVLPAGFAIYYYFKALKNLEVYFND